MYYMHVGVNACVYISACVHACVMYYRNMIMLRTQLYDGTLSDTYTDSESIIQTPLLLQVEFGNNRPTIVQVNPEFIHALPKRNISVSPLA